jgi:hypothetical protein
MFKNKKKIELLEKIDRKLSQVISILNQKRINSRKGDKKDV